jgi:hypothetical protein
VQLRVVSGLQQRERLVDAPQALVGERHLLPWQHRGTRLQRGGGAAVGQQQRVRGVGFGEGGELLDRGLDRAFVAGGGTLERTERGVEIGGGVGRASGLGVRIQVAPAALKAATVATRSTARRLGVLRSLMATPEVVAAVWSARRRSAARMRRNGAGCREKSCRKGAAERQGANNGALARRRGDPRASGRRVQAYPRSGALAAGAEGGS